MSSTTPASTSAPTSSSETTATTTMSAPTVTRYITTHDPSTGLAIFENDVSSREIPYRSSPFGGFHNIFTLTPIPVTTTNNADLELYASQMSTPPSIVVPSGTGAAIVYIAPGAVTPMHRTVSVEYDVVLEGEIEVELDGGDVRRLKVGDVVVMRGTMHRWRNLTDGGKGWARMFGVSHDMVPVEVAGKVLGEEWVM